MAILFIIDTLKGYGAEKSIVQIALNFQKFSPVFVHIYDGEDLKNLLEEKDIKVHSLNLPEKSGFKNAVKLISPIILKERPTIIHSTLFRADMISRKLKRKFPNIILVGSLVSNSYGKKRYEQLSFLSRIKLAFTQIRDRMSVQYVDYFICNSNSIKKSNIKAMGISEKRVKVIYRGRKIENYNKNPEVINLNTTININNKIIFFNVGRLNIGKGQKDLISSFKNLTKIRPDVILLIAGEGTLQLELQEMIKDLGLQKKVFLLGYREDIPELLSLAHYFVFPSYFEGLSGALIEAILSKTPCIVSNIPENKECFPNEGAIFFEPGNIKELSARMEEALNKNNWDEITTRSWENAQEKFNIKHISKQYEEFLCSILTQNT